MTLSFTLKNPYPDCTVKELLEEHLLIPRKIRHFLRTKKHLLINGETINWQSLVKTGDKIHLIFDDEDYPQKKFLSDKQTWLIVFTKMNISLSLTSQKA